MRDLYPQHPRHEDVVMALFVAAMVGYAMLACYVVGRLVASR